MGDWDLGDPQSEVVWVKGVPCYEGWSRRQRIIWILFTVADHLELAELIMFCRVQCNYF